MRRLSLALSPLALLSLLGAACSGGGGDDTDAAPPNNAAVSMQIPATSDCGATISAAVAVQNFVLEEPTGQPNQDGHGHYHIYLDDATGINYLITDFTATADVKIPVATASGAHTLRVELANNDHSPVAGGVEDVQAISVTSNTCVGASLSPNTVAAGEAVTVTIEVGNFILEEPVGQPNEDGHGHYHVYLDAATGGNYLIAGSVSPVDVVIPAATPAGQHSLRVSISDNAHVPLIPPVETILDITVQ
jgi:hypothetical protein